MGPCSPLPSFLPSLRRHWPPASHACTFILSISGPPYSRICLLAHRCHAHRYHAHPYHAHLPTLPGPYNNPTETYRYYSLPYCAEKGVHHKQRLGEKLTGDRREAAPYEIGFQDSLPATALCTESLSAADLARFKDAIHESYFFEMFVEDLPMWSYVGDVEAEDLLIGEVQGSRTLLYTHQHFQLGTNGGQIVSATVANVKATAVDITDVSKPMEISFTYSVDWVVEKDLMWKDRMTRYHGSSFLPGSFEIHWLSIINSFVLVLLLTAFLTIILMRVLKNDFSRYMELDEETMEEEESGWKLIHGDVFRFPQNASLFCAAVGTGLQLMCTTFAVLAMALAGVVSTTRRGSILAACVVVYCLTSFLGGYASTNLYLKMRGGAWTRCTTLAATLFPLPTGVIFCVVNTIALAHGSTSALPFGTIVTLTLLYSCISVPLCLIGGSCAKNYGDHDFRAPTRTTKVAREIPTEVPWYRTRPFQMVIAGFLPFSAIYIELHYIFASMWGHEIYTLFGILLFAFTLLVIVSSFITVALLYFQLAREDHRWWWATFVNGGMTGVFIYVYSLFYYHHRSGMTGLLQSSFYFGYMAIVSFGFFLMLGSASFYLCLVFVKHIYSRVKCD